jgi:hypothetical protein
MTPAPRSTSCCATTVFRYIREALEVLAALALSLSDAVATSARKAFVILDGTLLRIDRVGMGLGVTGPTTQASTRPTA